MKTTNRANRTQDLAGYYSEMPHYLQIRARINRLIDRYLAIEILSGRLIDLPQQFTNPHTRKWDAIDWQAIDRSQIIGVDPDLFLSMIAGATEIETPIREYSQESWNYMQSLHPQMAYFMGGSQNPDGSIATLGTWEKEERQHAPTFRKIYHQLTGKKLTPKPNSVNEFQPPASPIAAARQHALSRISTEWSAVSIYLWLMAHSTGALQQAIAQPLQDEVNHLAKFWGFSRWAFDESYLSQVKGSTKYLASLAKHHQGERTQSDSLLTTATTVDAIELAFTFSRVLVRLRQWNRELSHTLLVHLFGDEPAMAIAA